MKNFTTIFPRSENVHLTKDVGAIPYTFHSHLGYNSTLVCIQNGEYPHNELYTKGLHLEFIEGDTQKSVDDAWYEYRLIKKYLSKNAKRIDVLNLYHFSIPHVLLLAYYKFRNPKGIAYLKLDADFNVFPHTAQTYTSMQKNPIKAALKRWLLNKIDIISAESHEICARAAASLNHEVTYIPNGFFAHGTAGKANIEKKKNQFLTVGRLGNYQKNTESILRAFAKIYQSCDWDLVLIGPSEGAFLSEMQRLFDAHEGLKSRVIYAGSVSDKAELSNIYSTAKVFLLPSRWESFGLVVVEAQSEGCYLVLSDQVVPYAEFTANGQLGCVIPAEDDDALADAMLQAARTEHNPQASRAYAYKHFAWERICEKLNNAFLEKRKDRTCGE